LSFTPVFLAYLSISIAPVRRRGESLVLKNKLKICYSLRQQCPKNMLNKFFYCLLQLSRTRKQYILQIIYYYSNKGSRHYDAMFIKVNYLYSPYIVIDNVFSHKAKRIKSTRLRSSKKINYAGVIVTTLRGYAFNK
jgi:hypothetical protein